MAYYSMDIPNVVQSLNTSPDTGLDVKTCDERLKEFGENKLAEKKHTSVLQVFLQQFGEIMVLILIAAGMISFFTREPGDIDYLVILGIVIVNACIGFVQEYRAERAVAALKKMSAPSARVVRGGKKMKIPAEKIVPGDVMFFEAGDRIAADARLIGSDMLMCNESMLTGESLPVEKNPKTLSVLARQPSEMKNMVFMGTSVTGGSGTAIAVATGMKTEMGSIAHLIDSVEDEKTPLQIKLDEFGRWIAWICLCVCAVVAVIMYVAEGNLKHAFLTGVSLAVAAIPEGLPAIITIALALGVQKMAARKAVIKRLPAVETLGSATFICSDKTGTLTRNEMTVKKIFCAMNELNVTGDGYGFEGKILKKSEPYSDKVLSLFLTAAALCTNAEIEDKNGINRVIGDPTEGALIVAAAKGKLMKSSMEKQYKRLKEIPFDSDRKRMSVVCSESGKFYSFVKGAPDTMLEVCTHYYENNEVKPLGEEIVSKLLEQNSRYASDALRVLAVAYKESDTFIENTESELSLLGFAAIIDPARDEVKKAVEQCYTAGITPVMITGDHIVTARAIAHELNILTPGKKSIAGRELDTLSEEDFLNEVENIAVYARVSPAHKLRIVDALQKKGHVVAMTGDGVNDVPALKSADIGIAMGITGTDVTVQSADMVLADDNFATIVSAVKQGRTIFSNISLFMRYLLTCNFGEVAAIIAAIAFKIFFKSRGLGVFPLPLALVHILWMNLVTDGLPALALGMEPERDGIMKEKPRPKSIAILSAAIKSEMLGRGIMFGIGTVAVFNMFYFGISATAQNLKYAQTAAFTVLVFFQMVYALRCRAAQVFSADFFKNRLLLGAVTVSVFLQILVVELPFLQGVFKTASLGITGWITVISVSLLALAGKTNN